MAEVEQKSQPRGQPTDGMMVAAVSSGFWLASMPSERVQNAGVDDRVAEGPSRILAEEAPEPGDTLPLHDVIGVETLVECPERWRCAPRRPPWPAAGGGG